MSQASSVLDDDAFEFGSKLQENQDKKNEKPDIFENLKVDLAFIKPNQGRPPKK